MIEESYSQEQFDALVAEFEAHEKEILNIKRGEYASTDDRIQNFREIAAFNGTSPEQEIWSQLMKHIQGVKNAYTRAPLEFCWQKESGGEGLKQKIADSRNMLLLLAARLDERSGLLEADPGEEEKGTGPPEVDFWA